MARHIDPSATIWAVSIHDSGPSGFLSFDLLQILESLGHLGIDFAWIVTDLECTGRPIPTETILSFDQIVDQLRHVEQTIDATVLGWRPDDLKAADVKSIDRIREFPTMAARVAILAVDSSYFDVISKDRAVIDAIRQRFRDVRDQDPKAYF